MKRKRCRRGRAGGRVFGSRRIDLVARAVSRRVGFEAETPTYVRASAGLAETAVTYTRRVERLERLGGCETAVVAPAASQSGPSRRRLRRTVDSSAHAPLRLTMTRYDAIGQGYRRHRTPDARIASRLWAALGDAETVLNVGAGTGSYEPTDRRVVAVEPSETMIAQRPAGAAPVVQASAESLPFEDGAFDAAMAVLTVHHWSDWRLGVAEMARVARRVVVLTWDPAHPGFWLTQDYVPDILALDRRIFPPLDALASALGGADVRTVPIPHDCTDGFGSAYWRRPEAYLDPGVRGAMSSFTRVETAGPGLARLADDLDSGRWRDRYEHLLREDTLDAGYRLVVHAPSATDDADGAVQA